MRHVLLLALCVGLAWADEPAVERLGNIDFAPISEASGLAYSARHRVWWTHNDSGDQPRLFALDAHGRVVVPEVARERYHGETAVPGKLPWPGHTVAGAKNVDWEDIALRDGVLYIADLGNNGNKRQDLAIYLCPEPDPHTATEIELAACYRVRYPDQDAFPPARWHYDSESLFVDAGRIYVLTKHRLVTGKSRLPEPGTTLYRLDDPQADRVNDLVRVDAHATIGLWPTGADLSPDGRRLAVLTMTEVWVFERPASGDRWLSEGKASRLVLDPALARQAEAIAFEDDGRLRICNEQRTVLRVPVAALRPLP